MNGDAIKVLVDRIDKFLERHDTVPQAAKDELILDALRMVLVVLTDHSGRLRFLEKYKPYLQALAAAAAIAAGALITLLVSGKLSVIVR